MSRSDPIPSSDSGTGEEGKDHGEATGPSLTRCPVCGQPQRTTDPNEPCPRCALTASLEQSRADPQKLTGDAVGGLRIEPEGVGEEARYRVGDRIARGGMGEILEAREVPIGRRVAMKVIHDGMREDPEVRQRFIEEAQITGQLEHPSIVPMHDLSIDDRGHVFYTMKKVEGQTLASILSRLRKGEKEALRDFSLIRLLTVFQKICDAVAFAHSRGVIHRDLKPANVMIGQFGEVLVMDWGIARVVSLPELEVTIQDLVPDPDEPDRSVDGSALGTIGYMPPEQAEGKREAIGFHSDIYALGAILYEILTLRRTVEAKSVGEALKKIRSGEIAPITSATATGTAGQSKDAVVPRHCPGQRIPASLAAVAMKALEKEPEDRYESVEELQREIESYQGGFATEAENASFGRHLKLFVRRHKGASLAAAIIALLLVVGMVVSDQLRRRAVAAEEAATLAKNEAESTTEFLSEIIYSPVPERERVETVSYTELIDSARARLKDATDLSPASRLKLEYTLCQALFTSGRAAEGMERLETVHRTAIDLLDPGDPLLVQIETTLAGKYLDLFRVEEAIAIRQDLVARLTRIHGSDDPITLEERGHLAYALTRIGRHEEALEMMEDVWARAESSSGTILFKLNQKQRLCAILFEFQDREHLQRSLQLAEELLVERERAHGKESEAVTDLLKKLVETHLALGTAGDPEVAEMVEQFLSRRRKHLEGTDHVELMQALKIASDYFIATGDGERGLALRKEAFEIARRNQFRSPPDVAVAVVLAMRYRLLGQVDEAISILETIQEASRSWPEMDRAIASHEMWRQLSDLYFEVGRVAEARQLARDSSTLREEMLGPDHRFARQALIWRADLEMKSGSLETAIELIDKLAKLDWIAGSDRGRELNTLRFLQGKIAAGQGNFPEAIRFGEEAITHFLEFHSGRTVAANANRFAELSRWYEKEERWEDKLAFEERALHSPHGESLKFELLSRYARTLQELGRNDECLAPGMEWFALFQEKYPDPSLLPRYRIFSLEVLSHVFYKAGHPAAAVEVGEVGLDLFRIKDGETTRYTLQMTQVLLNAYAIAGQLPEARALVEETIGLLEKHRPEDTELIESWKAKRKP